MRVDGSAHRLVQISYGVNQVRSSQYGARQDVIMSSKILGCALEDKVDSKLDGPLVVWGAECTVYEGQETMPICYLL